VAVGSGDAVGSALGLTLGLAAEFALALADGADDVAALGSATARLDGGLPLGVVLPQAVTTTDVSTARMSHRLITFVPLASVDHPGRRRHPTTALPRIN
jgi:hypothetical protein